MNKNNQKTNLTEEQRRQIIEAKQMQMQARISMVQNAISLAISMTEVMPYKEKGYSEKEIKTYTDNIFDIANIVRDRFEVEVFGEEEAMRLKAQRANLVI